MRILAADTTTPINTVAVCDGPHLVAETVVRCGRAHSERLLATVDWVLAEAGCALADVDALAISIGPGSFTGLRVGAATWKGLALGARLPLVGVPTLDAMARLVPFHTGVVCPVLDAKMSEVFAAAYEFNAGSRTKLSPDRVCSIEAFIDGLEGDVAFLGDGADLYRARIEALLPSAQFAPTLCAVPRAASVALEGHALIEAGADTDPGRIVPVYLRKSQAEENRDKSSKAPVP